LAKGLRLELRSAVLETAMLPITLSPHGCNGKNCTHTPQVISKGALLLSYVALPKAEVGIEPTHRRFAGSPLNPLGYSALNLGFTSVKKYLLV
jgi:hypothetical protein